MIMKKKLKYISKKYMTMIQKKYGKYLPIILKQYMGIKQIIIIQMKLLLL